MSLTFIGFNLNAQKWAQLQLGKRDYWRLLDSAVVITAQARRELERRGVFSSSWLVSSVPCCMHSFSGEISALENKLSCQHFIPSVQYLGSAFFSQDWRMKLDVQTNKERQNTKIS